MGKLVIFRPDESFNKWRAYPIYLNGKYITDLKSDTHYICEPDQETVELKVEMGWGCSKQVNLDFNKKDNYKLRIRGNRFYNNVIKYSGGIVIPGITAAILTIKSPPVIYGLICLGAFILLYLLYALTADRESWLHIEELEF